MSLFLMTISQFLILWYTIGYWGLNKQLDTPWKEDFPSIGDRFILLTVAPVLLLAGFFRQ